MQAFELERFLLVQENYLAFGPSRHGYAVHPIDAMRIKNKLLIRAGVIKNRHFAVTDNDQFLLLERVQPAYEDVSPDAAPKI